MNESNWAEEKFGVLDHVPVGNFVLKADFTVLFWNSCLEEWTGISRPQIVGTNIDHFFPHLRESQYTMRLQDIFEGGPPIIFSSQLHQYIIPSFLPNGQKRIHHTTVTAVPTMNKSGFNALFSLQDVTDLTSQIQAYRLMRDQALEEVAIRQQAEESLQLLKSAVETIPLGITVSDISGKILYTNSAEAIIHGYTVEELMGQDVRILAPSQLWQSMRTEQINEEKFFNRESINIRKDGTTFPVQLISTPVKNTAEEIIGVIAACEDITKRKQAEETLRQLFEQVRHDAETKAVLLKEVNHRVKNNLTAIIGLFYAKQDHIGLENQAIYQPIMDDLINRVQGLATVHSMLTESEWNPLLLSDLTQQIVDSVLKAVPSDKYVLVNITPSPIRVTSDQAHNLALVINELATNSVKYAFSETTEPLQITVRISLNDDTVRFEFRNNGASYPMSILQQDDKHYGIGFELIQNIVHDRLGGKLSLKNDNGAVTIIEFKIS